jgi:hypothetical protein
MDAVMHVRNNTEHPIEVTPKVGGERVRFEPGWNEVPSGYIDRITGGFKTTGTGRAAKHEPRGGAAAFYFTEMIKVGGRNLPRLQVGTPVDGDDVHVVPVRPGLRSHYRTRQAEERTKREIDQAKAIASLEARNEALTQQLEKVLARLDGGAPATAKDFDPSGMDPDAIKDAIKGLDAVAVKQALGAEVAGENRPAVVKLLKARIKKG